MSQVDALRDWRQQAEEDGNSATAELVADKIVALTGDVDDAHAFAQILFRYTNYLRAADVLRKNPKFADNIKCRRLIVRALIAAGQYDDALTFTEREDSQLLYLKGEIYTQKTQFDQAKQAYIKAVRADSKNFEAFERLVNRRLLNQEEQRDLIASLDFQSMGDSEDLVKSLYLMYTTPIGPNGDLVAESLSHLSEEYDLGSNSDVLACKAQASFAQGNFTKCKELCEQVIAQDKYNLTVHPTYVCALYDMKDSNGLYKLGHELSEYAADKAITWVVVGSYYLAIENNAEARRYFSKATLIDPYCDTAWIGFGHTFTNEGEHEQAITAFSTAARLFPGAHQPNLFLGMEYLQLNNLPLAYEYLTTANNICQGGDALLLNEIGVLHYHRGELNNAVTVFYSGLELVDKLGCDRSTILTIKANLAYAFRRMGRLQDALKLFEEVARSASLDSSLLTALGLVHFELHDYDDAITCLNEALSLSRDDPVATGLLKRVMTASSMQRIKFDSDMQ